MFDSILETILRKEEYLITVISWLMIICGTITLLILTFTTWKAPYGRYSNYAIFTKWSVPARLAWFLQEIPSFLVPLVVICTQKCAQLDNIPNRIVIAMYLLHYFQRSLIYPMLISGGKSTPFHIFLMAFTFCMGNGFIQGNYHAKFAIYDHDTFFSSPSVYIGMGMFLAGMAINIHSDKVLRNLRKPGETGYKIPEGGLFTLVSGANFLGEIIEWVGYALVCGTLPAMAFAYFTLCNIGPRAIAHHMYCISITCTFHVVCIYFWYQV